MKALKRAAGQIRAALRNIPVIENIRKTPKQKLGDRCEGYVAAHLKRKGYDILVRNFECRAGEIDIIAFRQGTIAFVEVRSCTGRCRFGPAASVDYAKQKKLTASARTYRENYLPPGNQLFLRFDVAAVTCSSAGRPKELDYYEDAFRACP